MKDKNKLSSLYYRILCALIFFLSHPLPTLTITNAATPGEIDPSADHFTQFQAFSSQLARSPFLSSNQQNQILRDVQQHQHRFQFNQPSPPGSPLSAGVHHQLQHSSSLLFPHAHQQNPQTAPINQLNNVNSNPFPSHHQNPNVPLQVNIGQQQFSRQPQAPPRPSGIQQQPLNPSFQQPSYTPQSVRPDQQFNFNSVPVEDPNTKSFVPRYQSQENTKSFLSQRPQSSDNFNPVTLIPQSDRPFKNFIHPLKNDQNSLNNFIPQSNDQTSDLNNYILQNNQNPDNFGQTDLYRSIVRNTFNSNNQPPLNYVFEPAPTKSPSQLLTTRKSILFNELPQTINVEQKINRNILYQPTPNNFQTVSTTRLPEVSTTIPTLLYSRSTVRPKTTQILKQNQRVVTTENPISLPTESSQIVIKPDSQKILQQLIEAHQQSFGGTSKPQRASHNEEESFDLQKHLQALQKDNLLNNLPGGAVLTSDQLSSLSNFQFLQGENDTAPFFLGNGQKVKIIQVPNKPSDKKIPPEIKTLIINQPPPGVKPLSTTTTTIKPPKVVFEELTKGVLPPGADYEVIRQKSDGGLEEVGKIPQNLQKKVTFVILEEQPDGTVKVQGVRGNENDPKNDGNKEGDVGSLIKKIQEGEIKLPPSTKLSTGSAQTSSGLKYSNTTPQESIDSPSFVKHSQNDKIKFRPSPAVKVTNNGGSFSSSAGYFNNVVQSTLAPSTAATPSSTIVKQYTRPSSTPSSSFHTQGHVSSTTTPFPNSHAGPIFSVSSPPSQFFSTVRPPQVQYKRPWPSAKNKNNNINKSPPAFLPTPPTEYDYDSSISTNSVTQSTQPPDVIITKVPPTVRYQNHNHNHNNHHHQQQQHQNHLPPSIPIPSTTTSTTTQAPIPSTVNDSGDSYYDASNQESLNDILKKNGLFAMARFLRKSGLDTILNETGPYTVFVPTDRAFRALQVQLGGPDKAEEKFQENPRLLSGLLLHHVVPGAFTVEALQDEMTGVSLAGTQLRVNSYTTQDIEWNDVKVLTINGAKVVSDKKNILIPQGVAHAVDRVMFPLPVGDLFQTLRSDRDNRFTNFLKAVSDSGLISMFTGSKVYTVFAPVDTAFTPEKLDTIKSKEAAKRFVLRHLTPGTLYSAGMRYYQLRNSMENSTHLTLYKEAGHVKVNSAHVLTRNIPATNGVVHAIDALL